MIYSSYSHRDMLGVCHTVGLKSLSFFFKSVQFIFSKDKDKGLHCFKFSILDFDICLN